MASKAAVQDRAVPNGSLKQLGWERGRTGATRESWFLSSPDFPHFCVFWNQNDLACMTFHEVKQGNGLRMVWDGRKLENFSYGLEKMREVEALDESMESTLKKTCTLMRHW